MGKGGGEPGGGGAGESQGSPQGGVVHGGGVSEGAEGEEEGRSAAGGAGDVALRRHYLNWMGSIPNSQVSRCGIALQILPWLSCT